MPYIPIYIVKWREVHKNLVVVGDQQFAPGAAGLHVLGVECLDDRAVASPHGDRSAEANVPHSARPR